MDALGRREWVALGVFAFALLITATFVDASAGPHETREPMLGVPLSEDEGTRAPEPVATRDLGSHVLAEFPEGWAVSYLDGASGGAVRDELALVLDVGPGDVPDGLAGGDWRLEASTGVVLPGGEHILRLTLQGVAQVFVNGTLVAEVESAQRARAHSVAFDHEGGASSIRVVVTPGAEGQLVVATR